MRLLKSNFINLFQLSMTLNYEMNMIVQHKLGAETKTGMDDKWNDMTKP